MNTITETPVLAAPDSMPTAPIITEPTRPLYIKRLPESVWIRVHENALRSRMRLQEYVSTILESSEIIQRDAASAHEVLAIEESRFTPALGALEHLSEEASIPLAIVGDLATIHYGYHGTTQNIQVVVARDQLDTLTHAAPQYGFNIRQDIPGWLVLSHGEVAITVLPEGDQMNHSAPTPIPSPQQLGVATGLDYANLPGWMMLKLSAGRQVDQVHVREVMKKLDEQTLQTVREQMALVHHAYPNQFDTLLVAAREEQAQEQQRRGRDS